MTARAGRTSDGGSVPVYHLLTPGDHFSPRTGSAIPTVVHGLAAASERDRTSPYRHVAVVARGTYADRYDSAALLEYDAAPAGPSRAAALDYARALLGRDRRAVLRPYRPALAAVETAPAGIVVAHNAPFLAPTLAGGRHRVLIHAHNALPRSMRPHEARAWVAAADALVCVSTDHAQATRERLPQDLRGRVHAVPHGVDVDLFHPAARAPAPVRVVFVGRTIARKGPDVLVEAARLLAREDVEVTIIGSHGFDAHAPLSTYERGLRDAAARSLTPVRFQPFTDRDALPELLSRAHAVVVPSRWREPAGLTVGEGMASGAVVIASAVGGMPELLGDAGVLIPPDDPGALATALARVADDAPWREGLWAAARQRAVAHDWAWSWGRMRAVLDLV